MKKFLKRFGVFFVVVAMLVTMLPMTIFAEEEVKEELAAETPVLTQELLESNQLNLAIKDEETPMQEIKEFIPESEPEPKLPIYKHNGQVVEIGDVFSGADRNYFTLRDDDGLFAGYNEFTLKCGEATYTSTDKVWLLWGDQYGAYMQDLGEAIDPALNYEVVALTYDENPTITVEPVYFYASIYRKLKVGDTVVAGETIAYKAYYNNTPNYADFRVAGETYDYYYRVPNTDKYFVVESIRGNRIRLEASENRASVEIAPTARELTYNWTNQWLVESGKAQDGYLVYGLGTATEEPESYSLIRPYAKDAGTYYVYYKVISTKLGFNDSKPVCVPVTIKAREVDAYWFGAKDFTYDGTVHNYPTAYSEWLLTDVEVALKDDWHGHREFKDAGTYTFVATSKNPNYVISDETKETTVEVGQKKLYVQWPKEYRVYDGSKQAYPEVTLRGLVGGDTPFVKTSIVSDNNSKDKGNKFNGIRFDRNNKSKKAEFKNAGVYELKVELVRNNNYVLVNDTNTVEIHKAKVKVPTARENLVYNGKKQAGIAINPNDPYHFENWFEKDAGKYTATIKLDDKDNYVWDLGHGKTTTKDQKVKFTIAKKAPEADDFVFELPEDSAFDGTRRNVEVKLAWQYRNQGNRVEVKYYDADGNQLRRAPKKPGTYTVKANIYGKNFERTEATLGEFEILQIQFLEGDGSTYTLGSDGSMTFKTDGPFSEFTGIKIDGNTVDPDNYKAELGSTVVTLKPEYTETLAPGTHTIQFIYGDVASPEATFTVKTADAPNTGDTNSTWLWIFLSVFAVFALVAGAYKMIGSDV